MMNIIQKFMHSPEDREIMTKLDYKHQAVWFATWFGFGFLRPAPGTWGSFAALPFAAGILIYGGLGLLIFATFLISFIGIWSAAVFGKQSGVHDSKMIVIDEVAGQWLALWPAAFFVGHEVFPWIFLASFLSFRFFDIVKIYPADYFDREIKNAVGVVFDDLVAGAYSAILMTGVLYAGFG